MNVANDAGTDRFGPDIRESDCPFLSLLHRRVSFLNERFLITDIIGQSEAKEIKQKYGSKFNTSKKT